MALKGLVTQRSKQAETRKKVAIAYVRVSTQEQDEGKQRPSIMQWAENHNVQIVNWYSDHGQSAFRDESRRTGFWKCIEDAEQMRVNYVLIKDTSR